MPEFSVDDINISPEEFLSECRERDIKKIITWLIEGKYIKSAHIDRVKYVITICDMRYQEYNFNKNLDALRNAYYSLSIEEEEEILKIAKKFT